MLLILTNSIDGTSDVLIHLCAERGEPVFRFNIDLWLDYRSAWTPAGFAIRDPSGRTVASEEVSACLWRRPSLQDTPAWRGGTAEDRSATEAELHAVVREIAESARASALRLVEASGAPGVRAVHGAVAAILTAVPEWSVGWGFRWPQAKRMVKRFAPEALGAERDRHIFVQSVDAERLSPDFPWLTQEIAQGARDATVLYVNGRSFGFEMRLTRPSNCPWERRRSNSDREHWRPGPCRRRTESHRRHMQRLGLRFGGSISSRRWRDDFLEVNPNGQFAGSMSPARGRSTARCSTPCSTGIDGAGDDVEVT